MIIRFRCKQCRHTFSQATLSDCRYQKKRRLNPILFSLYASGVSQRRCARIFNVCRETVVYRLKFLSQRSQKSHDYFLKQITASGAWIEHLQFDELETFEHTKCKPLAVALAVEPGTRKILGFSVSPMKSKKILKDQAFKKYGIRKDQRKQGLSELFVKIKPVVHPLVFLQSDAHFLYPSVVKKHFPEAIHQRFLARRARSYGLGELKVGRSDPLFSLNHTCAMLRANVNRLMRRTWCTTKRIERLRDHLWIYIQMHNEILTPPRLKLNA